MSADPGTVQRTPVRDGVSLAYQTCGPADGEPLLLMHGLATQMLMWHDDLLDALARRGFLVVRYDHRDVGLSTHLHDAPQPDLMAALRRGDTSTAGYRLEDMADDAARLLDHLGIARAHVLGVSMGGMVAQALAVGHPERVLTLTSVMSTPAPQLGAPTREASAVLLAPPATSRADAVEALVGFYRVVGSPAHPLDEVWLRAVASASYDRAYDARGVARQLMAVQASGDRTAGLRELRVPTLVVHGEDDPLVQLDGGRATAEAIPGATLLTVPGMGHDLPRELWPTLLDALDAHTHAAGDRPRRRG